MYVVFGATNVYQKERTRYALARGISWSAENSGRGERASVFHVISRRVGAAQ